jgi:hypothetical protein
LLPPPLGGGAPAAAAAVASPNGYVDGHLHKSDSLQMRLSHRDSTKRPIFRKMGSLAYSGGWNHILENGPVNLLVLCTRLYRSVLCW